uniref:Uncharacterized protein n=1 Tax=Opuntia streptacantha TaxID=393608 RepID=A0A7C9E6U2_OPUST
MGRVTPFTLYYPAVNFVHGGPFVFLLLNYRLLCYVGFRFWGWWSWRRVVVVDFSGRGLRGGNVIVEIEGFEALEEGGSASELGLEVLMRRLKLAEIGVGVVVMGWLVGGEAGGEGDGEDHEVQEDEEESGG